MRITNQMLSNKVLTNLNSIHKDLNKYHTQISTGKRFQKASDDPIHAFRSMDVSSELNRTGQYEQNIDEAHSILEETYSSLSAVSDSLTEVKNTLLKGLSSTYNNEDRVILAQTVNSMKENIITQLNKDYAGKYLFGGFNTSSQPFSTVSGEVLYNNAPLSAITDVDSGGLPLAYSDYLKESITIQTGKSTNVSTSLPGIAITGYGENNMMAVLDHISQALQDPNVPHDTLENLTDQVDDFFNSVQNKIAMTGSKSKNLETMQQQIDQVKVNLTQLLSDIEDVDIEDAIIHYESSEMAYESALAVAAKIIQPTLIDFLR